MKSVDKFALTRADIQRVSRMLSSLLLLCMIMLILCTCSKASKSNPTGKAKSGKLFTILTLDRIKQTGFLKRIIPAFEQAHKCRVEVISCTGSSELLEYIQDAKNIKYDLVLGIDNSFFNDTSAYSGFTASTVLKKHPVNSTYLLDSQSRIIPYGYGYLAMLYNEQKISRPPESFGELQDARFLNQIAICDPRNSGIGRASLYWTIALFGNDGYQQFWKSIKKNVYASKDTWQEALQAVNSQDCSMTFGFTSTPAWIIESQAQALTNPLPIKASLMKEGSFLYIEGAAIPVKSKQKPVSEAFMAYLLSPGIQKFVAYDLGLFPTNESTPLPAQFSAVPFTTFTVNDKLMQENPKENLNNWLDFWERIFSHSIM